MMLLCFLKLLDRCTQLLEYLSTRYDIRQPKPRHSSRVVSNIAKVKQRRRKYPVIVYGSIMVKWQTLTVSVNPSAYFQSTTCEAIYVWKDFRAIKEGRRSALEQLSAISRSAPKWMKNNNYWKIAKIYWPIKPNLEPKHVCSGTSWPLNKN